jgi:hypothetical protein
MPSLVGNYPGAGDGKGDRYIAPSALRELLMLAGIALMF